MLRTLLLACLATALTAAEHPWLVWTKDDIAAMRAKVASDPAYRSRAEAPLTNQTWRNLGVTFHNLFRVAALDDRAAADAELGKLRSFIGTHPSPAAREVKDGGIGYGGRHYDNSENALRYDLLHDRLTAEERKGVEDTFRVYIEHQLKDTKEYTRTSWLPNMQWPRPLSAHFMAAALGDLALLEQVCRGPGGWFYYWDEYVADGRFYNEEFGKQYSMNGQILLFGLALRNLDRDQWGFGYTGKGGGSIRNYLGSYFDILLPGIDLGTPRMAFGYVTSGDQRHGAPHRAFPTILIPGLMPGQERTQFVNDVRRYWTSNRMNGQSHLVFKGENPNTGVSKMAFPLWMELCHAVWPDDARFAWALEQLAPPGATEYLPTPYFLRDPVKLGRTPPPAPSGAWKERGFALLRHDESSASWTGPAPAVGLRFANTYVHEVWDSFALTNYHAFNRMLIANGQTCGDYASTDPDFSQHIRGHTAVMVDRANPGKGSHTANIAPRFASTPEAKFTAIRAQAYPGVDQERALVLTGEYLLDVTRLVSATPRQYTWLAHPLGRPQGLQGFAPYPEMDARLTPKPASDPNRVLGAVFGEPQRRDVGAEGWAITLLQDAGPEWEKEPVGKAWFDRGIGVRIALAGAPGSEVLLGRRPRFTDKGTRKVDGKYQPYVEQESEAYGATTIAVERTAPATTFVALWEPFQGGGPAGMTLTVLADTPAGIVARVEGPGWSDRVAIRLGDGAAQKGGDPGVADWAWERNAGGRTVRRGGW